MSYSVSLVQMTKKGIDIKTTGATLIQTTENAGQRFYPLMITTEVTSASGIIAVGTMAVGTNASSYNNILAATALTGLTSVNTMLTSNIISAIGSVASNTGIYANVTIGATATTATVDVHIIGYYN